jgi:divalent metal cation (Fe/Co/Zn/Cd) transporter
MTGDATRQRIDQALRDGLRVSKNSFAWTMAAGSTAVTTGVLSNSLVLVAFGMIGVLDAIGSGSLIVHFRHAQRHRAVSERRERATLLLVTIGMGTVGLATVTDSAYRLSTHVTSDPVPMGMALAAASVLVLAALAFRKHSVATRIPSQALHADGWLSAMGALLALIALAGTGLDAAFGWWWVDPLAAIAVACGAISLSIALALRPT